MDADEWERLLDPFGAAATCHYRGVGTRCTVCQCFTEGRPLALYHAPACPVRFLAARVTMPLPEPP